MLGFATATLGVLITLGVAIPAGPSAAAGIRAMPSSAKSVKISPQAEPVGTTIAIKGAAGSKADVTLVQIIDPARATGVLSSVPAGDRLVGARFRLVGEGLNLFASADSSINTTVTGTNGRSYKSAQSEVTYVANIAGCVNIANERAAIGRGQSVSGCVIFTVPTGIKLAKVVYREPGGTTGQWNVR
jgi:hypothetical protein